MLTLKKHSTGLSKPAGKEVFAGREGWGTLWRQGMRQALGVGLLLSLSGMLVLGWWAGRLGVEREVAEILSHARMAAGMMNEDMLGQGAYAPPGDARREYLEGWLRRVNLNLKARPFVRLWVPAGQAMKEYALGDLKQPDTPEIQSSIHSVMQSGKERLEWRQPDGRQDFALTILVPVKWQAMGRPMAVLEIGVSKSQLEERRLQYQNWGWVAAAAGGLMTSLLLFGIFYRKQVKQNLQQLNAVLEQEHQGLQRADANVRKLSRALENCPVAVIITDAQGCIEYVNPRFEELTGYTALEAVGQNPRILKSGLMSPEVYKELWDSLLSRGFWVGEMLNRRKDGTLYWEEAHISSLKNPQGQVTNYVAAMEDITERKRAQEELQAAKVAAEEAAKAKSEFLANMSHEIRTPMNGVIGLTTLLEHTALTPEQRDLVASIRASGEALVMLINDILDYSKIEAGRLELHPEDFNLNDCIREVLQALSPRAAQKDLNLAAIVDPGVPVWVRGDVLRLRQVLINLMGNAIKFTAHGEVLTRISLGDPQARRGEPTTGGVFLHVSVKDTGPGIAPEHLKKLFQKFSQGDSSVTRRHGGTGLGLTISKRLTEMMGGRIWVESQVNEGSTFHFTVRFEQALTQPPEESQPPPLEGRSVVLLSDNYTNRVMLEMAARELGIQLQKAASIDRLWRILQSDPSPDLIILEVHQSLQTFAELVRELHHSLPGIRLAALTYREKDIKEIQPLGLPLAGALYQPLLSTDLSRQVVALWQEKPRTTATLSGATLDASLAKRVPIKILLVDDNPINLKVGVGTLEKLGYVPDVAADGVEALEALKRGSYDLVLLDVQMPRMDGLEVARRVRSDFPPERQPILVALTAGAMQEDRERCLKAGMDDYLSKPFRAQQLQQIIEKWHAGRSGKTPGADLQGMPEAAGAHAHARTPLQQVGSVSSGSDDTPVDFERLTDVSNNDPEMMAEMVRLFIEQADELLAGAKEGLDKQDAARVKVHAHKLRGSCGACGMMAMVEPLAALERQALGGQWTEAAACWQAVHTAYDRVKACLKQRLPYNPVPA